MKRIVSLAIVVLFFINFIGCAGLQPADLTTPKARGTFVNNTYHAIWNDYQTYAQYANLSEDAKDLLRAKRTIIANMHIGVSVFNGHVQTGTITDAAFQAILDKLLEIQLNWYMIKSSAWYLSEDVSDAKLRKLIWEAGLVSGTSAQTDPLFMGVLLELLRTGVQALRQLMAQRGLDEVEMAAAYNESWIKVQSLKVADLIIIP